MSKAGEAARSNKDVEENSGRWKRKNIEALGEEP